MRTRLYLVWQGDHSPYADSAGVETVAASSPPRMYQ